MSLPPNAARPRVLADLPVSDDVLQLIDGRVELLPWSAAGESGAETITAVYTYGHPVVNGPLLDRMPGVKTIRNFGVGVDHIELQAAAERGIPVGNTPGILDGATADMGFALLMAAGRRLVEGERYARGPEFLKYEPSRYLGREIHGATLGIIGMGRIGMQVARRAAGFDMSVIYHNRQPRPDVEKALGVRYASREELLQTADYVMLTVPLSPATRGLMGRAELALMKPTACLINIARGAVVDQTALLECLQERRIFAAALDVTDPEPLPRDHPLLQLDNLIITPHLGSSTVQTRRRMAELSVSNLLAGLAGEKMVFAS